MYRTLIHLALARAVASASLLGWLIPTVHAQGVIAFDDPSAIWYVADTYPHGDLSNPSFVETVTRAYHYAGDSMVGGFTWSILLSEPTNGAGVSVIEGLVRVDGDLVLFTPAGGAADTLYDLSLETGDSVLYDVGGFGIWLHVVQVDSMLLQGSYHRTVEFEQFAISLEEVLTDVWIEGIGSVHGPMGPFLSEGCITWWGADSTRLTCYERDDSLRWQHPGYPVCEVNHVLAIEQDAGNGLSIYPNPATTWLDLCWPGIVLQRCVVRDITGRILLSIAPLSSTIRIDLGALPTGAYLVEAVALGGEMLRARFVVE
jgi:hypothetical protein